MSRELVIAHDLGTSGNKATLFDSDGVLLGSSFEGYSTSYPHPGWSEQNPQDWWSAVVKSTRKLLETVPAASKELVAISFSGQMMGCLPLDNQGQPLHNAIIWSDQRASRECEQLSREIGDDEAYRITGTVMVANYLAAKILWLKENHPDIYNRTAKFLQAKDFIVFKLTGEYATDYSDASGTNLFDIQGKRWATEIIRTLQIDEQKLPPLHPSTRIVGKVHAAAARETGLPEGLPVVIGGGDGPCATVGAGASAPGKCYNIYGTSSWVSVTTAEPLYDSRKRSFILNHLDENLYMGLGTMQAAGASYEWLNGWLGGLERQAGRELDVSPYDLLSLEAEKSSAGSNGVLFLPYLMGERSPYWDTEIKGAFLGLTMQAGKSQIIRSVLEGTIFHLKLILDALEDNHPGIGEVRLIGGGGKSALLKRMMADIWGKPIITMRYLDEASSLGAAIAGMVGAGVKKSILEAETMIQEEEVQQPDPSHRQFYDQLYRIFQDTYLALKPINQQLDQLMREGR